MVLWRAATDYLQAIANCEITWLRQYAKPKAAVTPGKLSSAHNSPSAHIDLLQKFLTVIPSIHPADDTLLSPVLWHRDIHKGNIFVHDGKISSIIDWQSGWVGPMLLRARTPLRLDYKGDILLKLPENFKHLPSDEQTRLEDQVRRSILVYLYG
jgi:hypothetical protein